LCTFKGLSQYGVAGEIANSRAGAGEGLARRRGGWEVKATLNNYRCTVSVNGQKLSKYVCERIKWEMETRPKSEIVMQLMKRLM
jgi:hypothetical protein